jgi:hypothetical protein
VPCHYAHSAARGTAAERARCARCAGRQVLSKALEVFGLSCQNLDSPACAESAAHPERERAFLCNLRVRCTAVGHGMHACMHPCISRD